MPTTSLKLTDDLKRRVAQAASESGASPHAFMISAIEQATVATEQRASFIAEAKLARAETIESGKGFEAHQVHDYLKSKAAGKKTTKPREKLWRA